MHNLNLLTSASINSFWFFQYAALFTFTAPPKKTNSELAATDFLSLSRFSWRSNQVLPDAVEHVFGSCCKKLETSGESLVSAVKSEDRERFLADNKYFRHQFMCVQLSVIHWKRHLAAQGHIPGLPCCHCGSGVVARIGSAAQWMTYFLEEVHHLGPGKKRR